MGGLEALGILALLSSALAAPTGPQYPFYIPPYSDPQPLSDSVTTCGDGQIKAIIPKSDIPDALKNLEFHEMPVPGGSFFIAMQPDIEIQPPPILVKPQSSGPITPPFILVRPPPMAPIDPPSIIVRPPSISPIVPPPITVRFPPFSPTCSTQISDKPPRSNSVFPFTLINPALPSHLPKMPVQTPVYTRFGSSEFSPSMYELLKAPSNGPFIPSVFPASPLRSSHPFPSSNSNRFPCSDPSHSTSGQTQTP